MKPTSFLGSRLYNQIVYPLLIASVLVGIVATLVAVRFLDDLTTKWVDQTAQNTTANVTRRYETHILQMQRIAHFAASSEAMRTAADAGDVARMRREIIMENGVFDYESIAVLDSLGRVIAVSGTLPVHLGERAFGKEGEATSERPRIALVTHGTMTSVCVFQPITTSGTRYTLALCQRIDRDFLRALGVSQDGATAFYDQQGRRVSVAFGYSVNYPTRSELLRATSTQNPTIRRLLSTSQAGTGDAALELKGSSFRMRAEPVHSDFAVSAGNVGYLVSVVNRGVSQEASRTTMNLILMWSIVAIVALVGLGGWIARRVSDPLVELAAGARRIADGDFETKVNIRGANEIAELSETFNLMTDSLRERSESLTKKVLELATLYEMSRALGSTLDLDELLGSVLDSALRIFDLDLGYMALRDKDTGTISIRSVRGAAESQTDGALRSSMSEWVVREGRPLIFNPDSGSRASQIDTVTGARAALCVPLISPEGTIGSITIGSSNAHYRFNSDDVRLLSTIANHVTMAIGNIELFTSLQEAYLATVRSLAEAVDAKDTFTRGHSDRVATFATLTAERMGLSHEQRIALEMAAYLHDIGKIGVKEDILLKPGRLDDDEMAQMKHHPLIAANILKPVAFPWAITPVVRHHHEAFDGSGYPAGLRGDEIPLLARILTVADSYEAMTADRPYRAGRCAADALEELERCSGSQFDPAVVNVFAEVIGELTEAEDGLVPNHPEEIMPEEARAIFAALVDGLFASFRRLGGPRLASNVEQEVDEVFGAGQLPFRITRGRVTFLDDVPFSLDNEVDAMRDALARIETTMAHVSGSTLVEHFYADALASFSGRMRYLASELRFCPTPN